MLFGSAKLYRIRFGKFSGKTLDEIATTDSGLCYLDWLRGEMEGKGEHQHPETWGAEIFVPLRKSATKRGRR